MAVTLPLPSPVLAPPQAPVREPTVEAAPRRDRRPVEPSRATLTEHGARLAIVVVTACVAIFLDASTSYESAAALPYMQGALGATPDEGSWLVTLFNAAYETGILLSPWFLARFGRRATFTGSLLAFGAFSLACACTTDFTLFAIFRAAQGFALGGFFACGVIALFKSVPARLVLIAVMLFSMSSQFGSALGPALAGYLVYVDAWQWVFVLSAIPAFVLAAMIGRVLRDPEAPQRVRFDAIGAALVAVTFLALQYLVNEGERRNWTEDPWVALALVVVPFGAAALVVWKLRFSPDPFLDFRVLRHRNLVVGAIFGVGFGLLLQAATQIGGFVEGTLGFTPELGGNLDALRAVAIAVVVPIVTFAIAEKWLGVRSALLLGLALVFAGFRVEKYVTTATADFGSFIVPFALIGVGIAILYRALASVIFGSLPAEDLIMGLLVYKMSGVLGGALASPAIATLIDHHTAQHRSDLAGSVSLASPAVQTLAAGGRPDLAALAHAVAAQATTLAYADIWSLASIVVVVLAPVILLLDLRPKAPAQS
jgi:DHA2 family multidrug resistance protein